VIAVEPLDRHSHFIPRLVEAFAREWPDRARTISSADLEAIFRGGTRGTLPIVLVAFDGGDLLGTIALRPWFSEEPMEETPWVRQLLVLPEHRGRGIDRALGAAIEGSARGLGYPWLYAGTTRIEALLCRRGWEIHRRVLHDGQRMAWLRKPLQAAGELTR
jgi:GNAT superfamily N-acetyltransferase